jgi:predicted permease
LESLIYDLRHALRQVRGRPLLAAVAILSIAIGIGAATAVMSVADAMLFAKLPGVDDPSRIVEVNRTTGGRGRDTFSYPELLDLREGAAGLFDGLAGWNIGQISYASGEGAERLVGMAVSWNYFAIMGVRPRHGRFFTAGEDRVPMASPVAIVGERFWRRQLAADPGVIGRVISLDRHPFTIIGVVPGAFRGHLIGVTPDVYIPMLMYGVMHPWFDAWNERRANWFTMVGRLKAGVTIGAANAAVQTVFRHLPQPSSDPREARSAVVDPLGLLPAAGRAPVAAFLGLLLGVVILVLLVTSANVAGTQLARAAARSREIGIRLALGAGRPRLVRQLLLEALFLFAVGGAIGVALAVGGSGLLSRVPIPSPIPLHLTFTPDLATLGAGLLLALVAGTVFGLAPALHATRVDLVEALTPHSVSVGRGGRLRRAFVTAQVGLSLVLLLVGGMFLRSLQRAARVPTGFDPANVQTAAIDLSIDGYDSLSGRAFLSRLEENLRAAPGVSAAAVASDLPLDLSKSELPVYVAGSPAADQRGLVSSAYNIVSAGYFDALRIRVTAGRGFDAGDVAGATPAVVVSRTFAREVWPGEGPLGRVVRLESAGGVPMVVVGVVEDVKNQTLMEPPEPAIYVPVTQQYRGDLTVLARGAPGHDVGGALRRVLHDTDPALSVAAIVPLEQVTGFGTLPQRLAALLAGILGVLALLLSALGVYGVVAHSVALRTREFGVRIALGARGGDVVRLVLRDGIRLAAPGLAFGLTAGAVLGVVLRSFLLGLAPIDPLTFAAVSILLLGAVGVASWAPAHRAASAEPTDALRAE